MNTRCLLLSLILCTISKNIEGQSKTNQSIEDSVTISQILIVGYDSEHESETNYNNLILDSNCYIISAGKHVIKCTEVRNIKLPTPIILIYKNKNALVFEESLEKFLCRRKYNDITIKIDTLTQRHERSNYAIGYSKYCSDSFTFYSDYLLTGERFHLIFIIGVMGNVGNVSNESIK